jgi:hypothetical protein
MKLRASWIRDSSFTLYALIRLGFTYEANGACMSPRSPTRLNRLIAAYIEFMLDRVKDKNPDGSLQIMYTIHGAFDLQLKDMLFLISVQARKSSPKLNYRTSTDTRARNPFGMPPNDEIAHDLLTVVRSVGNGAIDHLQLVSLVPRVTLLSVTDDVFRTSMVNCTPITSSKLRACLCCASMDCIYLGQKVRSTGIASRPVLTPPFSMASRL